MPLVYPVTCHTDHVGPGSTFVAISGFAQNGSSFIAQAIEKGATCIVIKEEDVLSQELLDLAIERRVAIERVPNTRKALAHLSAVAAGYPAKKLKIIGITGTKGKTTTAYLLAHLLKQADHNVALLSSVENMIGMQRFVAPLTTPQPDYLHQFLRRCVEDKIEWVVMEVAAQAVSLHRIDGITFDVIIITNISREHLEFYASMDEYVSAKMTFCSFAKEGAPVWVNGDDGRLVHIKGVCRFGIYHDALQIRGVVEKSEGFGLTASIAHNNKTYMVSSHALCGEYNLFNVLAACAAALHVGLSWREIQKWCATFSGAPGRLERYRLPNEATVIIDYAHNPSSYEVLLSMLREQTDHLIAIFGAGGERDHGRRPEMGRIAAEYADFVILTTDNPRSEDPEQIVAQIYQGVTQDKRQKVIIELNRACAIHVAYEYAREGSIIALLGKGQEEYQLLGKKKVPFSEREIVRSFYRSRGVKAPL